MKSPVDDGSKLAAVMRQLGFDHFKLDIVPQDMKNLTVAALLTIKMTFPDDPRIGRSWLRLLAALTTFFNEGLEAAERQTA
jgi:L-alanine-DL-glutamate epimerase-like enolase superfamily enzyme